MLSHKNNIAATWSIFTVSLMCILRYQAMKTFYCRTDKCIVFFSAGSCVDLETTDRCIPLCIQCICTVFLHCGHGRPQGGARGRVRPLFFAHICREYLIIWLL